MGGPFPLCLCLPLFTQFIGEHPHPFGLTIQNQVLVTEIEVIAKPLFAFCKSETGSPRVLR